MFTAHENRRPPRRLLELPCPSPRTQETSPANSRLIQPPTANDSKSPSPSRLPRTGATYPPKINGPSAHRPHPDRRSRWLCGQASLAAPRRFRLWLSTVTGLPCPTLSLPERVQLRARPPPARIYRLLPPHTRGLSTPNTSSPRPFKPQRLVIRLSEQVTPRSPAPLIAECLRRIPEANVLRHPAQPRHIPH